ncbi:MAG: hypothetical protein A3A24_02065 [Candidatus Buchananbacteria bacterium RIFCSPLOWO2_01_FULL_46_12]|uniref:methylated-DNA--[protein]-cysteine S-methyltransferase n=1 Tax=Candidatus Buchananbacteria bacterium RIFCSPLOWO2_01_FULL_46_12 TaxID=1797546 RepID=A0A1G1YV33_9BACT|nr:MAG: hypothetical protein A3A24_02065 [Candidatus Buchananbacteria bacterium RIFCSPLOWO2_01_FULL_46_12]
MVKGIKFSDQVFQLLVQVPAGQVTTYKMLAAGCGRPRAVRAVGNILNKNTKPIIIPCHRVVRTNGQVGGYNGGVRQKLALLKKEGLKIKNHKLENLAAVLYRF